MCRNARFSWLIRNTMGAFSLLVTMACGSSNEAGGRTSRSGSDELLTELQAMDGQSGEFEGVYRPGLQEGASFEFCSKNECPDTRNIGCNPMFSDQAASELDPFWNTNNDTVIHMFVFGVIRTGETYGHMGEHLCEITISQIRNPQIIDTPLFRSDKFPDLTRQSE